LWEVKHTLSIRELEYISNIFQNICGFKISKTLSFTDSIIFEVPSMQEAIILSTYAQLPFLTRRKYQGIRFIEPISWKITADITCAAQILDFQPYYKIFSRLKQKLRGISEEKKLILNFPQISDATSKRFIRGLYSRYAVFGEIEIFNKRLRRLYKDEINKIYEEIKKSGYKREDFLLCILPYADNEFYVPENLFKYFAGVVLKDKGYTVTFPLEEGDLNAFKISELLKINNGKGIFLQELFTNQKLKKKIKGKLLNIEESIIVEVESSPKRVLSRSGKSGFGQLDRYMMKGYFDKGFVAGPLALGKNAKYGIISFDAEGNLFFSESEGKRFNEDLNKKVVSLLRLILE